MRTLAGRIALAPFLAIAPALGHGLPMCGTGFQPVESPAPQETKAPQPLPVEETVRRAIEALDRMEQGGDAQTLLTEATRYADMVRSRQPDHPRLVYIIGRIKIGAGQTIGGIRDLQAFTRTGEGRNDWKAFRVLGDAFVGNYATLAQTQYQRAYALNDREPSILLGLSRAAEKLGRRGQALQYADAAVRLDGQRTIAYLTYYARLLLAAGRLDDAVKNASRSLELAKQAHQDSPYEPAALRPLQSQYQFYMFLLRDKIQEDPASAEAYILFAKAGEQLGEVEKTIQWHNALDAITQGVEHTAPNTPPALKLERARLLALVGRIDEAVEEYEFILKSNPDHPIARQAIEDLRRQHNPAADSSTGTRDD